jgi:predicted NACHT family NTPase
VKKDLRQGVSEWIAEQLKNYPYSYFILTSRPYAVQDYRGKIQPKTRLSIIPFDDEQKSRFIQRWYECRVKNDHKKNSLTPREITAKATLKANNLIEQITQRPELSQLTRNPLMLNMIVSLHSLSQSRKLPNKRSDLYEQIISLQLGSRPLAKEIELILGASQSENILQGLALEMMIQEQREIEYEDLISKINQQFSTYKVDSSVEAKEFLKEIETISELIVIIDDYYEFAHLSFQEYLASKEIIKTGQENILIENWHKSWWRETILLYSAQFIPTNLLEHLIKINSEESIKLSKLCLDEIPEKKLAKVQESLNLTNVIEGIKSQVDNLLFAKLEEYLENGQWREADEETTRLMLQLGDKDEKGYFSVEDAKIFPKEELRTIDKLWLNYSDGKFGFSVQKQIYLEVGGKLDDYDYESYKKMGDRLGWRKNKDEWLSYSNFTFDKKNAPQGHLPYLNLSSQRQRVARVDIFSSLDYST